MNNKEERVSSYALALDDPNQLDLSVQWVSNGARGYLHGNPKCHRLPKHSNIVTHQLSVRKAAQRNCCDSCFDKGVSVVVPALREMQLTMTAYDNVLNAVSNFSKNQTLNEDFNTLRNLDYTERSLKSTHVPAQEHGFVSLHDRSKLALKEAQSQLKTRLLGGSDQILRLTATAMLEIGNSREMPADLVSPAEERLFGSSERSYNPPAVAKLYNIWLSNAFQEEEKRAKAIAGVYNSFELSNISQLEGLAFGGSTSDLAGAAKARWSEELATVSEKLISRWDQRFNELISKSEPVLLAVQIRRLPQVELTDLIFACHTVARNNELSLAFLKVPKLVAEWLDRETRDSHTLTKNRSIDLIGPCIYDSNTLDTAIKLWDPRSETFPNAKACLTSAMALNA
jgi:hypothetical protein